MSPCCCVVCSKLFFTPNSVDSQVADSVKRPVMDPIRWSIWQLKQLRWSNVNPSIKATGQIPVMIHENNETLIVLPYVWYPYHSFSYQNGKKHTYFSLRGFKKKANLHLPKQFVQEAHAQVDQDVWQVHNGIRPGRQEAGPAVLAETCGTRSITSSVRTLRGSETDLSTGNTSNSFIILSTHT